MPRVIIQAAAVGKPIVTFDVDGAWEIVEDGNNGFIVPMKDVNMMTEKIKILIDNKKLRKKMEKNSRLKVGHQWSIKNMVKEIDNIYQKLLTN